MYDNLIDVVCFCLWYALFAAVVVVVVLLLPSFVLLAIDFLLSGYVMVQFVCIYLLRFWTAAVRAAVVVVVLYYNQSITV